MFLAIAGLYLLSSGGSLARGDSARLTLGEFSLDLTAKWERLTDTTYGFEREYPLVRDLAPAAERATYSAEHFRPFLPAEAVAVGAVWPVDPADVVPLLRQFHPGATDELHHGGGLGLAAHGAWACLRSLDAHHAEVTLRVHADFLLAGDGEPLTSSWFTPGQFRGRMVIDRDRQRVVAFELSVPPARANVDVNIAAEGGVIADIGKVPRMELAGGEVPSYTADAAQISEAEARLLLERRFYPFAEIEWVDLASARATSLATGKPLHVIALFGSLTDESC